MRPSRCSAGPSPRSARSTRSTGGAVLQLTDPDGTPVRRGETPAGVAFFQRRPSHRAFFATGYDGVRRLVEATAYPLFATADELHGVVSVFWEIPADGDA